PFGQTLRLHVVALPFRADAPVTRGRAALSGRRSGRRLLPWDGCAKLVASPGDLPSRVQHLWFAVDPSLSPSRHPEDLAAEEPADDIIADEARLLERVRAHLAAPRPSAPSRPDDHEEQLLSLRDQIAAARLEDVPALVQQMERIVGIAARRAESVVEP